MSDKATRAQIQIGIYQVEGFMLPDGSYRMSLSQAAECIGKPARGTFEFLKSKTLKRLLAEGGGTFDFLDNEAIALGLPPDPEKFRDNAVTPCFWNEGLAPLR